MSVPKLSIGIPNYNYGRYLRRCLDSVLAEATDEIEVLVADNASTDESWALIQEYAERDRRLRIWRHPVNIGGEANWNFVLNQATGSFFQLLPSDDWMVPNYYTFFSGAVEGVSAARGEVVVILRPSVPATYCGEKLLLGPVDVDLRMEEKRLIPLAAHAEFLALWGHSFPGECTYRTQALQQVGGYPRNQWRLDTGAFFRVLEKNPTGFAVVFSQPMCVNHMHEACGRNSIGFALTTEELDFVHYFADKPLGFMGRWRWLWWETKLNASIWSAIFWAHIICFISPSRRSRVSLPQYQNFTRPYRLPCGRWLLGVVLLVPKIIGTGCKIVQVAIRKRC